VIARKDSDAILLAVSVRTSTNVKSQINKIQAYEDHVTIGPFVLTLSVPSTANANKVTSLKVNRIPNIPFANVRIKINKCID